MYKDCLSISPCIIDDINDFLTDPQNELIRNVLRVVEKYGTPEEINAKAREARHLPNIMNRLRNQDSPYVKDLEWLVSVRDKGAFVPVSEYRQRVLGDDYKKVYFDEGRAVTLEISSMQFFPFLIEEAKQAIDKKRDNAGQVHKGTLHEGTGKRQRGYAGNGRRNADTGRQLRGHAGYQGHRRVKRTP